MGEAMRFGAEVRKLREAKGIALRELARRVNMSAPYLSQIERGIHPAPSASKIKSLARSLRVDRAELLSRATKDRIQRNVRLFGAMLPEEVTVTALELGDGSAEGTSTAAMARVLSRVRKEIVAGLQHGEFEFTMSGERTKDGKYHVRVKAGRIHRFSVPDAELQKKEVTK